MVCFRTHTSLRTVRLAGSEREIMLVFRGVPIRAMMKIQDFSCVPSSVHFLGIHMRRHTLRIRLCWNEFRMHTRRFRRVSSVGSSEFETAIGFSILGHSKNINATASTRSVWHFRGDSLLTTNGWRAALFSCGVFMLAARLSVGFMLHSAAAYP